MDFDQLIVRVVCTDCLSDIEQHKNQGEILGTGFFIDKNKIITAYHVISTYFDLDDNVYINPINLGDNAFYEAKVITGKEQSQIAILELINKEFDVSGLKFTEDYEIIPQSDQWITFGHPRCRWNKGHTQKGLVSRWLNKLNSYNADLDLEMSTSNINDFSGISGAPLIVKDMLVGVILEQAEVGDKVVSLGAASVKKILDVIPKQYLVKAENNEGEEVNKNLQKIINVPFKRNSCFIGRKDILKELYDNLKVKKIQVLTGTSGVGKSQIAIMYSYRNIMEYDSIFWVRCNTSNTLINDYKSIGECLNIVDEDNNNFEECIKKVYTWLQCNDKWLLIFDNCEDYNQIYNYIPSEYNGHIIITSINPDWIKLIKPIYIAPFEDEEAVKLLLKRSSKLDIINEDEDIDSLMKKANLEDDDSIFKLSKKLGNLPLAINQAAAYIEENNITFREYMELYTEYHLELFQKNYDNREYEYTVLTVWKISLEKINAQLPLSIKLISFLSVFSNNKIPNLIFKSNFDTLKNVLQEDISLLKYNEAVSMLKKYALIEVEDNFFYMHCLIQDVIQNEMSEDKFHEYSSKASEFIDEVIPDDIGNNDEWKYVSELIPHLRYIIEEIDTQSDLYIELLYKLALCERFKLGIGQAENTIESALKLALQIYDDYHPKVLKIYNLLAGIKKDKGELNAAKEYYSKVLDIVEGSDLRSNPNIPIIKNNLGLILFEQGDYENAKKLFQDALESYKMNEKMYVKQIATTLSNLMLVNNKLEDYEEGKKNIEKALVLIEKNLGQNNVLYSRALNNKGCILMDLSDYRNAKIYIENAIKIDERFYHKNHYEILNKMNNLAVCLINLGIEEREQAKNKLNIIIEEYKNEETKYSKAFASIVVTLAQIYEQEKDFVSAIKYFNEAKDIYVKLYGELNLNVSQNNKYIANCLLNIDRQQAIKLYEDILIKDKKIFEKSKQEKYRIHDIEDLILEDLIILGNLLADEKVEKYKESIKYIKDALSIMSGKYKDDSIKITECIKVLSKANFELGDYDKAYRYAEKALKNDLINLAHNSEEVAMDYNNLAYILYVLGNKSKSKELIKNSMRILDKNLSISKSAVETIKHNLNIIMESNKDNIIQTINKYDFEFMESNDILMIRPFLKR